MRKQSSSSRRQRSVTPPELKIDRDEPDWDYSYVMASRHGWDYSYNADNTVDIDANGLAPTSQTSRRSHGNKVSSRKSHRSSVRKGKALLDQASAVNMCVKPACATEQTEEHSLFFQTFPDSLERPIKRPEPIHHRMDHSAPGAVITRKAKKQSHKEKGRGKVVLPIEIPDDSSWSSVETAGAVYARKSASFVTSDTSLAPPGCSFEFPFRASAPPKKDEYSQAACATEQTGGHPLFFQNFPDSLERPIKRPEPIHHRMDHSAPGDVTTRKAKKQSHKEKRRGKVVLPIEIPDDSSWSSVETAGAVSAMKSASFVTSETSLPPPECAYPFPFLPSVTPKKDDCSQASPNSVADIVGDLEELQGQLEALRVTSPQRTEGCKWSPSTACNSSRSTSPKALLAVSKVANFSRRRMDQLDAFLMAKSSGRDSPEALRLAYSGLFDSPKALQNACLEKPEPPVEDENEECPDTSRAYSLDSLRKSCLEKPEPPVEEEKEERPDTSTKHSLASFRMFQTSQDRDSPEAVPPPPPPRKLPRKSVCFAEELVTHVMHRPTTLPEENEQLYFTKKELQELEQDRSEQIYEEQFEVIHKKGNEVAVTFPVRRVEFPPQLMDISSSWDSGDGVIEI